MCYSVCRSTLCYSREYSAAAGAIKISLKSQLSLSLSEYMSLSLSLYTDSFYIASSVVSGYN